LTIGVAPASTAATYRGKEVGGAGDLRGTGPAYDDTSTPGITQSRIAPLAWLAGSLG